ncbi:uncharacterized protein LOC126978067 [Leptidea sinapis]|uniref:Uncharacterized protein n=1 Tax=Leptidea sinapis TaxID=189913 RepID=A0A5E4PXZ3_9NEOP|nr:uncharacterized protein LOC126978067 [Leptidea sinapis]VVC90135.1 unnamed protein product [Leptidea sinapis]
MVNIILLSTTLMVLLPASQSYILLSANMDDVHLLATQLYTSPVVDELGKIWRRASKQFMETLKKTEDGNYYSDSYNGRRKNDDEQQFLVELGKKATVYLKSFRRMIDNISD